MERHQKDLISCLAGVKDPRMERTRKHKLIDILVITVCAHLCSADNWVEVEEWAKSREEWLKRFLDLPEGIPSHDTLGRVFCLLDPKELNRAFTDWVKEFRKKKIFHKKKDKRQREMPEIVSLDGKVIRGTMESKFGANSAVGVVSAWSSEVGLVLGANKFDNLKGIHEKQSTEELLDFLYLKGTIVTLDAGGATAKICEKVKAKEADFVIGLKGNQGELLKAAEWIYSLGRRRNGRFITSRRSENEKDTHGREEKRLYELISLSEADLPELKSWQEMLAKWPTVRGLGRVKSKRNGAYETRYYLTSLESPDIREFARAVRSHWNVENQLHWVLDVAFREDHSKARVKNVAENLAVIRRMALNLLKQDKTNKIGIQAKRRKAGWDPEYLENVLLEAEI
jgi:predicted transposase YbfD/YdcC